MIKLSYIEKHLKIRDKFGKIIPLRLNAPQRKLYDALANQTAQGKPRRAIILKARQMGFSTLTEALLFARAANTGNTNCAVVSHDAKATGELLQMFKLYYSELPDEGKPELITCNTKRVVLKVKSLDSKIDCMTAGNDNIGRGATYDCLHLSEYAWWTGSPADTLLGLMQAVPHTPGSLVVIESTANGYNDFKKLWDAAVSGENEFAPVFCAWWELPEYRLPYDGFTLTEEERALQEAYFIDNEQLAWRRWCIANNCGGDLDKFRQEYPACPEEAFIASGTSIFDTKGVLERLRLDIQPCKTGSFRYDYDGAHIRDIQFSAGSEIRIYEDARPGVPYVIGADTAGGGSDWFAAQVIDNTSGRQVAVYRTRTDEGLFARQLYCLGAYYNDALIAVEANFSTYPIRELERLGYKKQYVRQTEDTFAPAPLSSYGFKTTAITRPVILNGLVDIVRESCALISDADTLREMLTFCKNSAGRAEALPGEHDDCVMALAIAYGCRDQQFYVSAPRRRRTVWTADMYEDYEAADAEQKEKLKRLWGEPDE